MDQKAQQLMADILGRPGAPSLSPLAVRLVELASDENASISRMAALIEQDPGLAAKLLTLVNSPSFRVSEAEIGSIQRAVVILGLREVRIMALGISLRHTLPLEKGDPQFYQFWRMSLYRAVLARKLALALGLERAEDLFVAGLLLELGLPLLLSALGPEQKAGFPGMGAGLVAQSAWARKNLGLDHRHVGAAALESWGLPGLLVRCQEVEVPDDAPAELRVVDLARMVCEAMFAEHGSLGGAFALGCQGLGISEEDLSQIIAEALVVVGEAAAVMDVELDQKADVLEVMEKANAALSRLSRRMAPHVRAAAGVECSDRCLQDQTMVNTLEAVAHEIRNPLMSVGGFARRLAKLLDEGGQLRRYAEVIINEAGRLDSVLAEMTSLARPFDPQRQNLDICALIRRVSQGRPVPPNVLAHLGKGAVKVLADPQGLERVLAGMLDYGAHLSRQGGDGTVHVHLGANGEAVMTVFGTGAGPMGEAPMAELSFGPEMAMARARRIVEAHGGRVDISAGPSGDGFILSARIPRKGLVPPAERQGNPA